MLESSWKQIYEETNQYDILQSNIIIIIIIKTMKIKLHIDSNKKKLYIDIVLNKFQIKLIQWFKALGLTQ